jgi:hypothetical protein
MNRNMENDAAALVGLQTASTQLVSRVGQQDRRWTIYPVLAPEQPHSGAMELLAEPLLCPSSTQPSVVVGVDARPVKLQVGGRSGISRVSQNSEMLEVDTISRKLKKSQQRSLFMNLQTVLLSLQIHPGMVTIRKARIGFHVALPSTAHPSCNGMPTVQMRGAQSRSLQIGGLSNRAGCVQCLALAEARPPACRTATLQSSPTRNSALAFCSRHTLLE